MWCDVADFLLDHLAGAAIGGLLGAWIALAVAWMRAPRAVVEGWVADDVRGGGTLYKVRFTVKGKSSPGTTGATVSSPRGSTLAKWDELPEPVEHGQFNARLVPATYYLPLFAGRTYQLPVLIQYGDQRQNLDLFGGWWYGRGTLADPPDFTVEPYDTILVGLQGLPWAAHAGSRWRRKGERSFKVSDIRQAASS